MTENVKIKIYEVDNITDKLNKPLLVFYNSPANCIKYIFKNKSKFKNTCFIIILYYYFGKLEQIILHKEGNNLTKYEQTKSK